jgi:hypothetical protein
MPSAKELQRLGETRMGATPARVRQLFESIATAIADTSKESARLHESSRRILERNHISWVSPLGRALMKSAAGDSVVLQLRGGTERLTLWNRSANQLDLRPRQRDLLAAANSVDED